MEKSIASSAQFVHRHLSQLKVLSRLLEHELELSKGEDVVFDKSLVESTLDTIEVFVEDMESQLMARTAGEHKAPTRAGDAKPQVTRLN